MTFKQFKTFIRKKIGYVNVTEVVESPIEFNSRKNWDSLFANKKFLKQYDQPERIESFREVIKILESHHVFENVSKMIDVGCGTGQFIVELLKEYPEIECTGTDFSAESIEVCKRLNINAEFHVFDIYADHNGNFLKYDLVVCSEVLEHLIVPEKAVTNLLKLLAPKVGTLVITVPDGRKDIYEGHIHFWSPESFKLFIENMIDQTNYSCVFLLFNNGRNNLAIIKNMQH